MTRHGGGGDGAAAAGSGVGRAEAAERLRSRLTSGPPLADDVARDVALVLERVSQLEQQVEELALLHATTVEASTVVENELSIKNELVSHFLASTSHEIRTPLNGIIGQAELLVEELHDEGTTRFDGDLDRIVTAGRHLLRLVNDILDLSKVESGRLELNVERVDLPVVVRDVNDTCRSIARHHGNELTAELEAGLSLEGDALRVRQCLLNLVANACRFTRNGRVVVRGWRERDAHLGDQVFLAVVDDGIGIAPEEQAHLFEPYRQAHAKGTDHGGTGLGLAYTRTLARRMGGDVKCASALGAGSTFTLRLPAVPPVG